MAKRDYYMISSDLLPLMRAVPIARIREMEPEALIPEDLEMAAAIMSSILTEMTWAIWEIFLKISLAKRFEAVMHPVDSGPTTSLEMTDRLGQAVLSMEMVLAAEIFNRKVRMQKQI